MGWGKKYMNINKAFHEATAVIPEQYPPGNIPEIVLAGRSNSGKSSLINTLLNRKKLARIGSTPGKTKQINFFNIDNVLRFVDFPGYGYAKVSKHERLSWGNLTDTYLTSRAQFTAVIFVLDIRRLPNEYDMMMHEYIVNRNIPYVIAATRCDKIPRANITKAVSDIRKVPGISDDVKVIPYSSKSGQGRKELWDEILKIANI